MRDGGYLHVLEAAVLPAGRRHRLLGGERPGREERAGPAEDDRLDAVWLAKLAERGMLRPSFVPPPWQRELRDLCRYRRTLVQERTREKQRAEKLLEDTQIKLSS